MNVSIDHLIVVHQQVELPDKCPNEKCDTTFGEGDSITCWEYQDQSRRPTIESVKDGNVEFDWCTDFPKSGESCLYLCWQCPDCHTEIFVAKERIFSVDEQAGLKRAPDGVLDLLSLDENAKV